ncbi:hypothetical protein I3843_01G143000 [Carya illinoinensis]|nr:hypothetical protein I3843_01G143000 [Carya illinoinensis]
MKLDQQIPMLLVERQALNEAIVGEKNVINDLLVSVFYLLFHENSQILKCEAFVL